MNTLEAVYFPGTTIYSASQFPIFLLLDTLHLLRPVEAEEKADASADTFISSGRCQEYTPIPLGENRDRFLRLVNDIRLRKDDYAAQLGSLTIASLGEKKGSVDDTSRGIITSLLSTHGVETTTDEQPDATLWQARLILKIAEILDVEEEEVAMQLSLLDDRQQLLFQNLQGELEEDEESLVEELNHLQQNLNRPSSSSVKNRCSAWSRLYLAAPGPQCRLWLTHLGEAAEILLERCEKVTGNAPTQLASFPLPANLGWSRDEAAGKIATFNDDNSELRSAVATALQESDPDALADLADNWAASMETAFPTELHGRSIVHIYDLSPTNCAGLLGSPSTSGVLLAVVG